MAPAPPQTSLRAALGLVAVLGTVIALLAPTVAPRDGAGSSQPSETPG